MTRNYAKFYIEDCCKRKGIAWAENFNYITNTKTSRMEITPGKMKGGRQTYNVKQIRYWDESLTTSTEEKNLSLTTATALLWYYTK